MIGLNKGFLRYDVKKKCQTPDSSVLIIAGDCYWNESTQMFL